MSSDEPAAAPTPPSPTPSRVIALRPIRNTWSWVRVVVLLAIWPLAGLITWWLGGLDRFSIGFLVVAFLIFAYLLGTQDVDLETGTASGIPALVRRRRGVAPIHLPLDAEASVRLLRSARMVQLVAIRGTRTVRATMAWFTLYLRESRSPEVLRQVADALDGSPAEGARDVAEVLRGQAAHLDLGGSLDASPLAAVRSRGL